MQIRPSRRKLLVSLTVAVVIWGGVALAWLERQAVYDWWRLRGYDPPAAVSALADDTTMNDNTRRLFYVYHPDIESKGTFNSHCRDGEFTIVLGCYVSRQGIYIYSVTDPRLAGVEDVTAAHEMLHAAYERLSTKERKQVDIWTQQAYNQLADQRLKDTIEQYRQHDPSVVPNELHSILGTEVGPLPAPLENYYKRYFTDRAKVVSFSDSYEGAFGQRKAEIDQYESQLEALKTSITAANDTLKQQNDELKQEYQDLEAQRDTADPDAFNRQASAYNARVKAYNQLVASTTADINQYNQIYEAYKKIVVEQQDLFSAIDSRPKTLQTE